MIGVGGMITTICLLWYYDATAFRYCKCGDAVGNRQRRVNAAASAIDSSNNLRERLFQKRLEQLYEYRKLHGHGSIPTPYPPNPSLGIWAANIRRQYTLYSKQSNTPYTGYLTPSRQKQLLLAGFDFTSLTERQFQSRVNELLLFKKQHGHCMVPEKWESNPTLGAWVSNIRTLYRKKRRINEENDASSTNISNGNVQNNRQRRKMKVLLSSKKLMKKQKVAKQKRSPRFTHLDEERINLLTQIGFVWSSIDKKWFEMLEWANLYGVVNYQLRQQSFSIGGGCDVSLWEDDDKSSNTTTAMEQHQYNNSSYNITQLIENYYTLVHNIQNQTLLSRFYPQDNIFTMLLNMDSTNVNENDDTNNYHFQSSHLDYRVPPNDTYHQPLRIWMINQRSNYNRLNDYHLNSISTTTTATNSTGTATSLLSSTMTPQRQRALESINFPWSGRYRNRIEEVQCEKLRQERLEEQRRQLERKAKKEREERERVERLLLSPKLSSPLKLDVMELWAAEDDDDKTMDYQ